MTAEAKRLTLETWMLARDTFRARLRKILRIVLAAGLPLDEIRRSVLEILDELQKQED